MPATLPDAARRAGALAVADGEDPTLVAEPIPSVAQTSIRGIGPSSGAVVGDQTGEQRSWALDLLELAVVVVLVVAPAALAWRATGAGIRSARLTATVLAVALLGWLLVQLLLNAAAGRY